MKTNTRTYRAGTGADDGVLFVRRKRRSRRHYVDPEVYGVWEKRHKLCEGRILRSTVKLFAQTGKVVVSRKVIVTSRGVEEAELDNIASRPCPVCDVVRVADIRCMLNAAQALDVGTEFREIYGFYLEQAQAADAAGMIIAVAYARQQC